MLLPADRGFFKVDLCRRLARIRARVGQRLTLAEWQCRPAIADTEVHCHARAALTTP
jgi:hypothetical protein